MEEHYSDFSGSNVCFIKEILIKSKYRGYQIGAKAIKDLAFYYSAGCGLFVLQSFPLQFEVDAFKKHQTFELEKLEQSKPKAKRKLITYYKSIGFESVKRVKDLLFYNPALINKKFDAIDLEAFPFDSGGTDIE